MPRKQNGFGSNKSFAFSNGQSKISIGKIKNSGTYPKNNRFGSLITRSPVDKFNIDATWSKWRKGYEYFTKQRWVTYDLNNLTAEIFPSNKERLEVLFSATRFPTAGSDDSTHYTVKRRVEPHSPFLRYISGIKRLGKLDLTVTQEKYREKWSFVEYQDNPVILKLQYESLTTKQNYIPISGQDVNKPQEKITNAIVKNILTADNSIPDEYVAEVFMPAIYTGNSKPQSVELTIRAQELFSLDENESIASPISQDDLQQFVGKQIAIFNADSFYNITGENIILSGNTYTFEEIDETQFKSSIKFRGNFDDNSCGCFIYDAKPLTSDSGVVYTRDILAISPLSNFGYSGEFIFDKKPHQRWFNVEFNATLMRKLAEFIAPLIPTAMTIQSITGPQPDSRPDENIIIECVPFTSQIVYCKRPVFVSTPNLDQPVNCYLMVNSIDSFSQQTNQYDDQNNLIQSKLKIDLNPNQDENFQFDDYLWLQDRYSCDCPSYSQAVLTAPESRYEENTKKANRQRRYPVPTAGTIKSSNLIDNQNDLAGIFNIWRRDSDQQKFNCCKHTISAMFADGLEVIEPDQYPIYKDRIAIEEKIVETIDSTVGVESIKRSELSATNFVWALVQLLVQSTAAIISTQGSNQNFRFKPLEFLYSFRRARNQVPTVATSETTTTLFTPKPGNIINL